MGIITSFLSLFFYPPLLVLRFISFLALLPARIFLLPLRIFFAFYSTIYSAAWEFFKTFFPHSLVAPGLGALIGYVLHRVTRLFSSSIDSNAAPSPPLLYEHRAPRRLDLKPTEFNTTWTTPLLTPPESVLDVPISPSPFDALLPPDSPLLSKYHNPHSPTEPIIQRPQQSRNVSYRSTMRQLMAERQEQLIALHEEEKRRRAALQLSPLPESPAHVGTKGWKDVQSSPLQPPGYTTSSSPLMSSPFLKERKRAPRPTSWPPLAVPPPSATSGTAGAGPARVRPPLGVHAKGPDRGSKALHGGYNESTTLNLDTSSRGLGLESMPRTILEEDTTSDESDGEY